MKNTVVVVEGPMASARAHGVRKRRLPCVSITPLGSPVVPEVQTIVARSPAASCLSFAAAPTQHRVPATDVPTPFERVGMPGQSRRCNDRRLSFAAWLGVDAIVNFAPLSAICCRTWAARQVARASARRAADRRLWTARSTTTHSGRFADRSVTRSPGSMPRLDKDRPRDRGLAGRTARQREFARRRRIGNDSAATRAVRRAGRHVGEACGQAKCRRPSENRAWRSRPGLAV